MIYFHDIDPIAISLGPVKVHWYGIMYLLGFTAAWVSEHIILPNGAPYPPSNIFYEPVLTLTWAAAYTTRIKLGTTVLVLHIP